MENLEWLEAQVVLVVEVVVEILLQVGQETHLLLVRHKGQMVEMQEPTIPLHKMMLVVVAVEQVLLEVLGEQFRLLLEELRKWSNNKYFKLTSHISRWWRWWRSTSRSIWWIRWSRWRW